MQALSRVRRWFVELNLFESGSTKIEVIQQERWSSRVNIVLLLITLCSIAIYIGLDNQTTHVTINNPSYDIFLSLQQKYSATLKCPCSKIAIRYDTFLQLQPSYHQVCSSSFISEAWILASYGANASYVWPMDARTVASSHAQFFRSFCTLSQLTLESIIIDSLGSVLISPQALFATFLELQVNNQLEITRSTGPWLLRAVLISMRLSITGNQFISGLGTNIFTYMAPYVTDTVSIDVNTYEMMSGSICHCYPTINCLAPAAIYSTPVKETLDVYHLNINSTPVKGMQIACYPLEGLLSSTLECYFDSACLQLLVPNLTAFVPLNSTETNRFPPNTTMDDLVADLLVEQWSFNYSAEAYFQQCAPPTCGYFYTHRNTFLTIITTITAIFGGLNTILRLIVPWLVRFVFKLKQKFVRPSPDISETVTTWAESAVKSPSEINRVSLRWLWTKVKVLNLFDSYSNDALKIQREQHTTRLYIILLSIIFLILFFSTTFTKQTKTYTINRPTQVIYENLQMKYADTIECPCSNVTIPYENFISISPIYHQVCSTGFILPSFINQLFLFNQTKLHRADFMAMSAPYFTWIASLCTLCQVLIYDLYNSFQKELFVNAKVLPENIFTKQTDDIINSFADSSSIRFVRSLSELLELTDSYQVLSASYSSFDLQVTSNGSIRIDPIGFANCSCLLEPKTCSTAAGFYSYDSSNNSFTLLSTISGIRVSCLPLISFLQSNLECWYSTDCYQQVIEFWRNQTYSLNYLPPLLDQTVPSRYNTSTLILTIVDNLMIEEWSKEASYSSFFDQCNPSYCTYSHNERPSAILIITTVMGIFSGLNVALKLFTPLILRAIYWVWAYVQGRHNMFQPLREFSRRLFALNLFYNRHKSSTLTVRNEVRATRLYVLLFISIFIILLLYNVLDDETVTITIQQPTQITYEHLYSSFSSSLQCPCSQITIPYRSFVEMNTTLHQICSSSLIDTAWIESIYGDGDWSTIPINEFRVRGVAYFFVLQSLCSVAQGKINSAGPYFFDGQIISGQVIPENQLFSQINSDIDQMRRSYTSDFIALIQFGRDSTQGNQVMSIYSLNWIYSPRYDRNMSFYQIPTEPIRHGGNCSCATSSACTEPVFVNDQIIPGFLVGCSSLESSIRSTLICLYNQTCLNLMNIANISTITPLDSLLPSRFQPNMTVEEIITNMFIEQWSSNVFYSAFFTQCQPSSCSYLVSQRKSFLKIITILLGIYGGLTTVLHVIAPLLIVIASKIIDRFRGVNNAVVPFH